ncbi:MAG TPA: hypothetical protein VF338_11140 [Leptolinea sp.]
MPIETDQVVLNRYMNWADTHLSKLNDLHSQMLALRQTGLQLISDVISKEIAQNKISDQQEKRILFDHNWLMEFATGDIVKCLGPEFGIYQGRRSPRIPNGDLLLMSRIIEIQGSRGHFEQPSMISAELDIAPDAWFYSGTLNGELPLSILLEIALQPCGVLSAWLGTQLKSPDVDYFFRNLDGQVVFLRNIDIRGQTIQTNATLLRTVFSGSTIIQHFQFEMKCAGEVFFKGTSSFGYFPDETMATQAGLDGGKRSQPWGKSLENISKIGQFNFDSEPQNIGLPDGKLRLIDGVGIMKVGGIHSQGYVMAERDNNPKDWFYINHFFQDPVMPGSLGIEAIVQAFKSAIHMFSDSKKPVTLAPGVELEWKYRGQVLPNNHRMLLEIHVEDQVKKAGLTLFTGSANLWADDLRIYEIHNLAFLQ